MVFVLFDQEEVGLVGSTLYADQLVAEATVVDSVHVFDMISWDGDEDGAAELWSPSPQLEALYVGAGTSLGIPVSAVPFQYSDHQSFLDKGFVTVGVSEEFVGGDYTPHYHQPTDTYDKIEFPYLTSITRLALTVIGSQVAP
jgi:Zn-dependent M28 family amino/carboxypeptidase